MSDTREHETTVTLCGLEIPVTVVFEITTYGSSPSGYGFDGSYDPGESDEFEILSVTTEFGRDILLTLDSTRPRFQIFGHLRTRDALADPLLAILAPYRLELVVSGETLLDRIEAEIREHADLSPPEFDDYDPRDYE